MQDIGQDTLISISCYSYPVSGQPRNSKKTISINIENHSNFSHLVWDGYPGPMGPLVCLMVLYLSIFFIYISHYLDPLFPHTQNSRKIALSQEIVRINTILFTHKV